MTNFLTQSDLMRKTPSVFTMGSSERTSDKYQQISTNSIVERLMQEGFQPTEAMQTLSRSPERKVFAKHLIRFRRFDAISNQSGIIPELILINSHDGLSSYKLMAGFYRFVCGNGLIVGSTVDEVRVRHQGDIMGNVIEGTYSVIDTANHMLDAVDDMSSIKLSKDEQRFYAESAHSLRFDDSSSTTVIPSNLLIPKRRDDIAPDLFTTFNVVQENIMRGGVRAQRYDKYGRVQAARSRPVKSIDQNVKLNRALWSLAEKMRELKQ